jgi:hypothetical protein
MFSFALDTPARGNCRHPANQSISISLAPDAAEFARRAIVNRGYPPGTGLRVADVGKGGDFVVQFDVSSDLAEDWIGEHLGVPVLVEARMAKSVSGKTIELIDGNLTLRS